MFHRHGVIALMCLTCCVLSMETNPQNPQSHPGSLQSPPEPAPAVNVEPAQQQDDEPDLEDPQSPGHADAQQLANVATPEPIELAQQPDDEPDLEDPQPHENGASPRPGHADLIDGVTQRIANTIQCVRSNWQSLLCGVGIAGVTLGVPAGIWVWAHAQDQQRCVPPHSLHPVPSEFERCDLHDRTTCDISNCESRRPTEAENRIRASLGLPIGNHYPRAHSTGTNASNIPSDVGTTTTDLEGRLAQILEQNDQSH